MPVLTRLATTSDPQRRSRAVRHPQGMKAFRPVALRTRRVAWNAASDWGLRVVSSARPTADVRQAIVIVHGMGEQRPLETLKGFVDTAIPPLSDGERSYHSRPDKVVDSYESRRIIASQQTDASGQELYAQTEVYEYHWAHLMEGNRLDDLWPTFRRVLLRPFWKVPNGLVVVWFLFWGITLAALWSFLWGPFSDVDLALNGGDLLTAVVGTGAISTILTYLISKVLPGWLTSSFVDVVRYLDTSPRSYEARRQIRKGMVDLLAGLHESGRYQRIIVVAHSLGGFIAYDGITYLWPRMNKLHAGPIDETLEPGSSPSGLADLEEAACKLVDSHPEASVDEYRDKQHALWLGLRAQGNPWLITDFITFGTPMYMADVIVKLPNDPSTGKSSTEGRGRKRARTRFDRAVELQEIPTCPPVSDGYEENDINSTGARYKKNRYFSWNNKGRRVIYHGAPFAVVRWTNLWFPAHWGFFGDWFGGELSPLFGPGIKDIALQGDDWKRRIPGQAHTLYFTYPNGTEAGDVACILRNQVLRLDSTAWLAPTCSSPKPLDESK